MEATPQTMNGWNPRIRGPLEDQNSSSSKTFISGFELLIFGGVTRQNAPKENKARGVGHVKDFDSLVVSTHLKHMLVKMGNLPQVGMKMKNIWNHHLVLKNESLGGVTLGHP